jgi:hypothetical protein
MPCARLAAYLTAGMLDAAMRPLRCKLVFSVMHEP